MPETFRGSVNFLQDDIAIVVITEEFELTPNVQPVCVDWDNRFEYKQLSENQVGVVSFTFPLGSTYILQSPDECTNKCWLGRKFATLADFYGPSLISRTTIGKCFIQLDIEKKRISITYQMVSDILLV